jgi:hypothetical protein
MEGENIYTFEKPEKINLILGNEGNGMSPETEKFFKSASDSEIWKIAVYRKSECFYGCRDYFRTVVFKIKKSDFRFRSNIITIF